MENFQNLTSLEEVNAFVENNELAFLYFTTPNCSVCHGLQPQIEKILEQYPAINAAHIDSIVAPEAAGQYSVFAAPVLLLFIDGKEYIREARIVHTEQLNKQLSRIYKNVVG